MSEIEKKRSKKPDSKGKKPDSPLVCRFLRERERKKGVWGGGGKSVSDLYILFVFVYGDGGKLSFCVWYYFTKGFGIYFIVCFWRGVQIEIVRRSSRKSPHIRLTNRHFVLKPVFGRNVDHVINNSLLRKPCDFGQVYS